MSLSRTVKVFFLTALFAALPFAVLAGGSSETADSGAGTGGTLTVYTYDVFPEAMEENVVSYFRDTYDVEVTFERFEDTGGLYNQLFLERDNPGADVMIGLDNTYLGKIGEYGLLQPYKPQNLKLVHDRLLVDPEYRAIPFDFGRILLNYNAELLPDPPKSWDGLFSPSLKGKIIMMNPATSSPGRNFLLYTVEVFGEDGYLDFWRKLKPNILTVTAGWSEGYGLYTEGEAPIVLSYDTSPAYHILFENETKYHNLIIGDSAYAQVEVAGIVNGTKNVENAKRFIDYIVSSDFQSLIPENQVMYPVNPDAKLPEAFSQVEQPDTIVIMDERRITENFDRWLAEWEEVMR